MKKICIAAIAAIVVLSGCATGGGTTGDLVPMAGVMKLTEELVEGDAEKAAAVRDIATDIRAAATAEEFATVDLLITAVRARVPWDRISPVDAAIAEELIKSLRQYLLDELGADVLPEHMRLTVEKVSGWVILAARP